MSSDFSDFTESAYREVLAQAISRYSFEPFGTQSAAPHVLWRHDVDFSVHRAVRLAEIEAGVGATATYFFSLHSTFYNLLERSITDLAGRVVASGHRVGIHFDASFYGDIGSSDDLHAKVGAEAQLLGGLLNVPIDAVSFHNPESVRDDFGFDADEIAGLVNAYGRSLRDRYSYVSDSNGYWRFRRLGDVLTDVTEERLHVLTHPEWWQEEVMAPRERVVRCVEGRAAYTLRDYDEQLARWNRENLR